MLFNERYDQNIVRNLSIRQKICNKYGKVMLENSTNKAMKKNGNLMKFYKIKYQNSTLNFVTCIERKIKI